MKAWFKTLGPTWLPWGKVLLAALFSLVFLMLFTGLLSGNKGAKGGVAGSQKIPDSQVSGLALMQPLMPEKFEASQAPDSAKKSSNEIPLIPGDILVGRCALSPVPSLNPIDAWTHACLYIGNNLIVVAGNPLSGVIVGPLSSWMYPDMTWVSYLRVVSADDEIRRKAVDFALSKQGQPYDLNWFSSHREGESWYCSELVWAAYFNASDGRINLARSPDVFGVSPDEIYASGHTEVIGGHYEKKPDTISSMLMKICALCVLAGGAGMLLPQSVSPSLVPRRRRQCRR